MTLDTHEYVLVEDACEEGVCFLAGTTGPCQASEFAHAVLFQERHSC
jgi:hypothetical protein